MTRFPCVSVHRPISDNINIVSLSIRHLWTHTTPLGPSLPLSLSPSLALSFSRSHTPLPHTHSMSLPNSLLPPARTRAISLLHMSHHSPFPYTRFTSSVVSLLHIHSLPLTHKRVHKHTQTCTNTHLSGSSSLPMSACVSHTLTL